jgi:hypothetical protein
VVEGIKRSRSPGAVAGRVLLAQVLADDRGRGSAGLRASSGRSFPALLAQVRALGAGPALLDGSPGGSGITGPWRAVWAVRSMLASRSSCSVARPDTYPGARTRNRSTMAL